MARHSTLRASDADRDAVAERLRAAAVEGRLEPDELEERLHRALRARTYGELDRLLGDLPGGRLIAPRPRRAVSAGGTMLVLAVRLAVALAVVSVLVIAIALTAMWWLIGIVVWLTLRGGRSCRPRGTFHRRRPAHPF